MAEWHTLEIQDAVRQIHSDSDNGLTAVDAARRLEESGLNELVERAGKSAWSILLEQFTGIMVVILIISAIISAILGETIDAIVIMIIVVLNAVLGFVQEYRAERAMAALKSFWRLKHLKTSWTPWRARCLPTFQASNP